MRLDWGGETCTADTIVVNENGALVLAPEHLLPGLILELENRPTGERARARVVSSSREADPFGFWQLGVALLSPRSGFFRVPAGHEVPSGHERRRSRRLAMVHPVELVRESEAVPGRTRNVSRHGALVLSPQSWSPGELVRLRSPASGREGPTRVVRAAPAAGVPVEAFDVALEFDEPPPDFWGPEYDL